MEEEQQLSLFDSKGKVINVPTEEMNKFAERLTNKGTKRNFLRSNKGRDKFLDAFNSYTESQQNKILDSFNEEKTKWGDMQQIVKGNAYAKSLEEQWGSPIKKVEDNPLFKADDYVGIQQDLVNPNYAEIKRNIKENISNSASSRPSSNFSTYVEKERSINNLSNDASQQTPQETKRTTLDESSGKARSSENLSRKAANRASIEEDMTHDQAVEANIQNQKLAETLSANDTGGYQGEEILDKNEHRQKTKENNDNSKEQNLDKKKKLTDIKQGDPNKGFETPLSERLRQYKEAKSNGTQYSTDYLKRDNYYYNKDNKKYSDSEIEDVKKKYAKEYQQEEILRENSEELRTKLGKAEGESQPSGPAKDSAKVFEKRAMNENGEIENIERRFSSNLDERIQQINDIGDSLHPQFRSNIPAKTPKSSFGHNKAALAVGAIVGMGSLVTALSDSRGQQSNAQLYGQQPIQY